MKINFPIWALKVAEPADYKLAQAAHSQGKMQIKWPDLKELQSWSKQQGWMAPWFGFEEAFINTILENGGNFALAIKKSGIQILFPLQEYTLSAENLKRLDEQYDELSPNGQRTGWSILVEHLREIRRAVEAGVVVKVEDKLELRAWDEFYYWAHGRYHLLEEYYDKWIGDDN